MVRSDEMGNGGFSLTGIDQAEILETISMISVTVIDFGKAEVRGLTTSGIIDHLWNQQSMGNGSAVHIFTGLLERC
jgi:hypothetical protein